MNDADTNIASGDDEETSFHPIAGGGILFSARQGRLYALNPVASLTWLCVKDGLSATECIAAISDAFNVHTSSAAEWFSASVELFQSSHLLWPTEQQGHVSSEQQTRAPRLLEWCSSSGVAYRLLDQNFYISAPEALQSVVDSLLANLRLDLIGGEKPRGFNIDIAAHGSTWDIAVDGRLEASCATESVAAEIERLVVQRVVPAIPHLVAFHAAAVQHDGRPFLLAGQSGAGKTTLSLALGRAGWDFGSDEIVLLRHDLHLTPLPLPPCLKANVLTTVETWFPQLRTACEHNRYGKRIRYLPIRSVEFEGGAGFVVFPRYDRSGRNDIQFLDSFVGLQRLLAQCIFVPPGFRHEDVKLLLLWHSRQKYLAVQYDHCDSAVAFLTEISGKN